MRIVELPLIIHVVDVEQYPSPTTGSQNLVLCPGWYRPCLTLLKVLSATRPRDTEYVGSVDIHEAAHDFLMRGIEFNSSTWILAVAGKS